MFYGLQVLEKDGVVFSSVPQHIKHDLANGRLGTDIAVEHLEEFVNLGIRTIYLMAPILRGGDRNYDSAQLIIEQGRRSGY